MKVFILEDATTRMEYFTDTFKDVADFVICSNIKDAVDELMINKFDIIFLDYDLDQVDEVNKKGLVLKFHTEFGIDVARAIKFTKNIDCQIVIHSWSEHGARDMANELSWSGKVNCEPFGTEGFTKLVTELIKGGNGK